MKAAQVQGKEIIVNDIDDIYLGIKKGAIVKVLGCGLCGSDIVKFRENLVGNGAVLGHEIVGKIKEINSVTDLGIGDRIVSSHHIPCGHCSYCAHGNVSMCEHFKKTNINPGGFSQYVYLTDEHLQNVAYKVPQYITDEEISFYEPLACCVRAIKRANLMKDDKVLIVGLGSIGLLMGEGIRANGYKVYGCDLIPERLAQAERMGIEAYSGEEVDAVFMTSGSDKAIETALKSVRNGGKIIVFSSTPHNFGYPNNDIYYKELTIMGSYSPSPSDLKESFDMIVNRKVNVKGLTTVYPLEKIQDAFNDTISNKIFKAYIKIGN